MANYTLRYGLSTDGNNYWALAHSDTGVWSEVEVLGLLYNFVDRTHFENVISAREDDGEKDIWEEVWAAEERVRGGKGE